MDGKRNLVVIGNGMSGTRVVEEILARDGATMFNITMFGDEPFGNYNRIMLANVLDGSHDTAGIFLNPLAWYEQNGIRLHAGVRVTRIFRFARRVTAADGSEEPYDNLIIATGSRSYIPPVAGIRQGEGRLKPGVFGFRNLDDCQGMAQYAAGKTRAAVVGGGLLGLECARGLQSIGLDVHLIHRSTHLMNQQLDPAAGAILKSQIERMGICVHLGADTKAVLGEERVHGLEFRDGERLECELVVFATGIQPNHEIASQSGLTVERAIVVDNQMRTVDDTRIYAVGECVQHRGKTYGLVAPLWEQAKVLADHITGVNSKAAYHGSKVSTRLKVMGIELASMGLAEPSEENDEVVQFTEPSRGTYKKLIIREDRLVGSILLGDISKAAYLLYAFDSGARLPEERLRLLFDIGAPPQRVAFEQIPAAAQICNCNGVSKGTLIDCVKAGRRSAQAVMEATRAGMGCGACKSMVGEIVQWACGGETEEDPSAHYYVPGIPLTKPELVREIRASNLRSVAAVFRELASGVEDALSKPGLASLLHTIWDDHYEDERDARFINDRVHANIQKDGSFSVIPQIPGGVTSPAQLHRIADVAEKYKVPMIKLTGGQRIDLLGVKKDDLPRIWQDLGMSSGYAYAKRYRTCKSCVGSEFCRFGLGDSTTLAIEIEKNFQGIETPAKLKLATAGCPRNCSEAMVKDLGAVAVEGGRWEIYIGGASGASVRKGDILCVVDNHEDVIKFMGRFIQFYRENAKYLERTYTFVERLGIAKIRSVVADDAEGVAATLDASIRATIESYHDPWREAYAPATANQFASTLHPMDEAG
ncbi:MAG: nitrite reductase large subunit NirB [Gammaproteobacteria bacterium]